MSISFAALNGVVMAFNMPGTLVVNRHGLASVVNNRRVAGALTPVLGVTGSVFPVSGESLLYLEEQGLRRSANIEIFTPNAELLIADDDTQQPGDLVTHHGTVYEIIHRATWDRAPFYHYFASQVNL